MTLNSFVIRIMACGTAFASAFVYATEAGLIDGVSPAQANTGELSEALLFSGSTPAPLPVLLAPNVRATPAVALPQSSDAPARVTATPPALFQAPVPTPFADDQASAAFSPLGLPCDVSVSATAMPAAIAAVDVMAPCRPNSQLTIVHSGLHIVAVTDAMGILTVDIPGFESPAHFSVRFEGETTADAALVTLPDLEEFDRIGLSWRGDLGFELHAMEFGASFGDSGHVWHAAPASTEAAITGAGGFLTEVNTGYSHAQVYTLPRSTLREGSSVQLSVDAPITAANCARAASARTLRTEGAGPVDVTEVSLTMPQCETVGDVLVLQNLLEDLRLASN